MDQKNHNIGNDKNDHNSSQNFSASPTHPAASSRPSRQQQQEQQQEKKPPPVNHHQQPNQHHHQQHPLTLTNRNISSLTKNPPSESQAQYLHAHAKNDSATMTTASAIAPQSAVTSSAWMPIETARSASLTTADPSIFEDAEDDDTVRIPSGDAALRFPSNPRLDSAAMMIAAAASASRLPSLPFGAIGAPSHDSLNFPLTSLGLSPSDWLQAKVPSASLLASLPSQASSSIELLQSLGLLDPSGIYAQQAAAAAALSPQLSHASLVAAALAPQRSPPNMTAVPVPVPAPASTKPGPAIIPTTTAPTPIAAATPSTAAAAADARGIGERTPIAPGASQPIGQSTFGEDDIRNWDVLCGRGGKSNHHPGNKRYRQVVSEMKNKYRGTSAKTDKTALSRAIVDYVNAYGGRFVKRVGKNGKWILLTKAEARKKTSQALRETKELKWTL